MRNKKLLYILLPTVLIVWGLIAYKIITGLHKDSKYQINSIALSAKPEEKDSTVFQLLENYRDPFLGTAISTFNPGNTATIKKNKKNEPVDFLVLQQANETWLQVSYGGLIEGEKHKEMLGLLSFKGKSYLLHKGQWIENIEVKSLFSDSARLCFKGQNKTILKKK